MLTKMLVAVVMTGALWVAGDAAYQRLGNCSTKCGTLPRECCYSASTDDTDDCCSTGSECCVPSRECCLTAAKKTSTCCAGEGQACCDALFVYCTISGEVSVGCCCEVVDGERRCLVTGTAATPGCCIPIE